MNRPLNPLTAIQHESPWSYYSELVREKPIYFEDSLKLWVISDAASIDIILNDHSFQVRPLSQPVPHGIETTAAGEIYSQLIRMREGEYHQQLKDIITQALSNSDLSSVQSLAKHYARLLLDNGEEINNWMFTVPAAIVANLCGFMPENAPNIVKLIAEFVLCIPINASIEHQQRASFAASELLTLFSEEIAQAPENSLLTELLRCASKNGWVQQAPLVANAIGFLSQTYDATAGLVGNVLLLIQLYPDLWKQETEEIFIKEAARYVSPIQNTRRFATKDMTINGHKIVSGDTVLLLLAAANHDPKCFPQPEIFKLERSYTEYYSFSGGRHRCPGAAIARAITLGMLSALDEYSSDWYQHIHLVRYLPSGNARIPELTLFKSNKDPYSNEY